MCSQFGIDNITNNNCCARLWRKNARRNEDISVRVTRYVRAKPIRAAEICIFEIVYKFSFLRQWVPILPTYTHVYVHILGIIMLIKEYLILCCSSKIYVCKRRNTWNYTNQWFLNARAWKMTIFRIPLENVRARRTDGVRDGECEKGVFSRALIDIRYCC